VYLDRRDLAEQDTSHVAHAASQTPQDPRTGLDGETVHAVRRAPLARATRTVQLGEAPAL
jgi:hypothetical protein